jgi:glutathione S-transferase
MGLSLYYAPTTCAMVSYINLTEAGAEFDIKPVNFFKAAHFSPEFLQVNPLHKVPVLDIDGQLLKENLALQLCIARRYPAARLLPSDPLDELRAISLMAWFGSGIHPHLSRVNSPPKFCDVPGTEESVRRLAVQMLMENFQVADDLLAGRDFFFDHYTAVDAYFFWCFRRGTQFELPMSQFTHAHAHFDRMLTRPSVIKAQSFEKATIAEMKAAA